MRMLEAFGLPSMQGSAGTWGWGGEGRGLGGAQGHQAGVAWQGAPWGSVPPASIPASSGGLTVTEGDTAELLKLQEMGHIGRSGEHHPARPSESPAWDPQ